MKHSEQGKMVDMNGQRSPHTSLKLKRDRDFLKTAVLLCLEIQNSKLKTVSLYCLLASFLWAIANL
jgi:hypothetical protein